MLSRGILNPIKLFKPIRGEFGIRSDTAALVTTPQAQLAVAEERERGFRERRKAFEQRLLPAPRRVMSE